MLYLLLLFFIPYLWHGDCWLFTIVPAIPMAGYQCLMPLASFIYLWVSWVLLALYSSVPFSVRMRCSVPILKPLPDQLQVSDNGTRMTQIRWMTAKIKSFDSYVLLSNIKTHLPLKCFFCRSKDENVKLFWCSLIITIRGQKRAKMRQKGLLKVPNWKKIIFQLRKNIFPTGK